MNGKIARGKRIDNGELIVGELVVKFFPKKAECTIYSIPVESQKIDYFTGKIDKNGRQIFSGDIVRYDGKDYEIAIYDNSFIMGNVGIDLYCEKEFDEMAVVGNIHTHEIKQ